MNMIYGEVSWTGDAEGERKNSRDLFLRLNEGPNEMRILTKPFQYILHRYKREDDTGYGQKINCSSTRENGGDCPLCKAGDKPKLRWLIGVISRTTGTYKILDIPYSVYADIKKLAISNRWGDPTKYDVDIVVDKKGGSTGYYSVQPISKEPLSAADQQIKDSVD